MSFKEKSYMNEQIAKISKDNKSYDASINRYYYSFFQLLKHKIEEQGIESEKEEVENSGSHNYIFASYRDHLLQKGANYREVVDMNSYYRSLKNLRKKADYLAECSSEKDIEKATEYFYNLKEMLMWN